jgi:Peptidase A4 family
MVGFECPHGTIKLNGSTVCHDSTLTLSDLGTGFLNYTMTASPDSGYAINEWNRTGDACLGFYPTCLSNSTLSPVGLWESCSALGYCSGTVVLSSPAVMSQLLTARIYNGSGSMQVNGNSLTDGQTITLQGGSVVNVSGNSSVPGLPVWGWVSDDGQFLSPRSNATTLTVRNSPGEVGNVTLLLNGSAPRPKLHEADPAWTGLQFSGTGFTQASGTYTIPSVGQSACNGGACTEPYVGVWVGIGGGYLPPNPNASAANLWQAGVCVVDDSSCPSGPGSTGLAAYAFYETWPQATPQYYPSPLIIGSTVTITVTFSPVTSTSAFEIVCDSNGGTGCGWSNSTWSRPPVTYIPNASTCEWIAEYVADYGVLSFWGPSSTSAAGYSSSFDGSGAVSDGYSWGGGTGYIWDYVSSVTASTLTLR